MLVSSSVKSHKLQIAFYCLFLILSTVLINIAVGIILPLGSNIENKINNHISNREIVTEFEANVDESEINNNIEQLKALEHVVSVYQMPSTISVSDSESSGDLSDRFTLNYIHSGCEPVVTAGRAFSENEKGVALVPEIIKKFNAQDRRIEEIPGESLIGKQLELYDDYGNAYSVKAVGTYDDTEPLFSAKDILIPQSELLKYNENLLSTEGSFAIPKEKTYIIQVDSYKNTDSVLEAASEIRYVYKQSPLIDSDMYSMALIVMFVALGFFIAFVIFGMFIFMKTNVNNRVSELALYRALGYKSKHIFKILFSEHLLFGLASILVGILLTLIVTNVFVNSLLYDLVGNTLMEMKVNLNIFTEIGILLFFLIILLFVCRSAVKRSEKIDLTILLREA